MSWIIDLIVRATWQWATPLVSLLLCARAAWSGAPERLVPALVTVTGELARVTDQYVTDAGSAIELVAAGTSRDSRVQVVRGRLAQGVYREAQPHRLFRSPGEPARWQACWRICRTDARGDDVIGCIRKVVKGNNHPDLRAPPVAVLKHAWSFDLKAQRFVIEDESAAWLPPPRELPPRRAWSGLRFFVPLPLSVHTPAVAKRAILSRGGRIAPTSATADVLVLPDRADVCAFDRGSHPEPVVTALRRGLPVVWERDLEVTTSRPGS